MSKKSILDELLDEDVSFKPNEEEVYFTLVAINWMET